MSESQVITKLAPTVKVSTLDGHRITSQGGPRGGQPQQNKNVDVVIKDRRPIEATMSGGGVAVKHPPQHHVETRNPPGGAMARRIPMTQAAPQTQRGRAVVTHPASAFTKEQVDFLGNLVMQVAQSAGGSQLELATTTLAVLAQLRETAK